jgi:DNA-binding transcriptional regulator YdaS (Cro superfamily)
LQITDEQRPALGVHPAELTQSLKGVREVSAA